MLFKDVHASIPLYLFDRSNLCFKTGKVTSFTPSHIDVKAPTGKMVVDITVAFDDGTNQTYTVEDGLSAAFFGTTAISLDIDAILGEVEGTMQTSEQRLASRQHDQDVITKCKQILLDHNPALKEKAENEARFSKIEEGQAALSNKLDSIAQMMEKLMG